MNQFRDRIEAIRDMMRSRGWDAVVLTGVDPHNSEYSAPRWHQIAWVSGYTGEGDLVITEDHAGLWTDTRYFIQAERQLQGKGIELHKTRVQNQVLIPEWLSKHFEGYDEVLRQSLRSVMLLAATEPPLQMSLTCFLLFGRTDPAYPRLR